MQDRYRKKGEKQLRKAARRAASNTCTPRPHPGTSIIALRISARAFTFQQACATRVRHEAGGSETETARMVSLSRSPSISRRRAHSTCVRGDESSGTTSHRKRTATGHRHSSRAPSWHQVIAWFFTKGLGDPNPPKSVIESCNLPSYLHIRHWQDQSVRRINLQSITHIEV